MKNLLLIFLLFSYATSAQIPEPSMLWLKGIGGNAADDIVSQVSPTTDGGFVICFNSNSTLGTGSIDSLCLIGGNRSIFVKYNADASILEWSMCYLGSGDTGLAFMFPQNDGGNVFGGEFLTSADWGFYICKQNSLGNIIWSHGYSQGNSAIPYNMIATNDGGYIMIGDVYYTDTNFTVHNSGSMNADIGVLKVDSLGNKQWSEAIGGSEDDEAFTVIPGPYGGYYILGSTESSDGDCSGYHAGGSDAYLVRLDSAGNIIWHNDLGGSGYDGYYGWCVADGNGGVLIATGSNSSDGDISHHIGGYDFWVLDVDSSNNIVWNNCFGGIWDELPYAICKATDGSIWVTGTSYTESGEVDTAYGNTDAWIAHVDNTGNFLSAKVLGSNAQDAGQMIYPLSNNAVITGGYYSDSNGSFSSINYYGQGDAFLAVFSPWTEGIKQIANSENDMEIYPNPANEYTTILVPDNGGNIQVLNCIGENCFAKKVNQNTEYININTESWAKGLYIVKWQGEDGVVLTKKFIKN